MQSYDFFTTPPSDSKDLTLVVADDCIVGSSRCRSPRCTTDYGTVGTTVPTTLSFVMFQETFQDGINSPGRHFLVNHNTYYDGIGK